MFKKGDKVRCKNTSAGGGFREGNIYIVKRDHDGSPENLDSLFIELDSKHSTTNGWGVSNFELFEHGIDPLFYLGENL